MLYTRFDEVPEGDGLARFRDWVSRRAQGEPVAYLVGHREFFSLKLAVGSRVLIPRPETEHVVTDVLDYLETLSGPVRVLDVGTGSGAIAVAVAKHAPNASLVAVDISDEALQVARANAATHDVTERIEFVVSDLFQALGDPVAFDVIAANPPYIGTDEKGTVAEDVVKFEPHTALFSGADGMELIGRLIAEAPAWLRPGGRFVMELSPIIAERCLKLVSENDAFQDARLVRDFAGHQRVLVATRRG